jgi:hypothetical protein
VYIETVYERHAREVAERRAEREQHREVVTRNLHRTIGTLTEGTAFAHPSERP